MSVIGSTIATIMEADHQRQVAAFEATRRAEQRAKADRVCGTMPAGHFCPGCQYAGAPWHDPEKDGSYPARQCSAPMLDADGRRLVPTKVEHQTWANDTLYPPGSIVMLPEPLKPLERQRIEWYAGMVVMPSRLPVSRHNTVKDRLLAGDPDWQEFKQRWAAEHGPIGDEG